MRYFVSAVVVVGALMMVVLGAWCRFEPVGFARWANWPVHEHFLRDAGVFQIAIGLMMASALRWRDAVTVVLVGFLVTNLLHAVNHLQDRADGGRGSDPLVLLAVAALAAAGLADRLRQLRRTAPDR
jgi:hypothetical protein